MQLKNILKFKDIINTVEYLSILLIKVVIIFTDCYQINFWDTHIKGKNNFSGFLMWKITSVFTTACNSILTNKGAASYEFIA